MKSVIKYEHKVYPNNLFGEFLQTANACLVPGELLREEYQPFVINQILEHLAKSSGNKSLKKILQYAIACGAGKTYMFLIAYLVALKHGLINNALLTAPTHALIRQHLKVLNQLICNGVTNGIFDQSFKLSVLNISADKIKDQYEEEKLFGIVTEDTSQEEFSEELQNIETSYSRLNVFNKSQVEVKAKDLNTFQFTVSCIPSAVELFTRKDIIGKISISLGINDENHHWQTSNKSSDKVAAYTNMLDITNVMTNFSATPKKGLFLGSHMIDKCGELGAIISTASLREWGYVKPNVSLKFLYCSNNYQVPSNIRALIEDANKIDPQILFHEWEGIITALKDKLKQSGTPSKAITASSLVAINKLLKSKKCTFTDQIKSLFNSFTCHILEASSTTENIDREKLIKTLKNALKDELILILQHSLFGEGYDAPNLDTAIILRNLSERALNQFINRVTRKSKNDPSADTSYIYILVRANDIDSYLSQVRKRINDLFTIGLTVDDITSIEHIDVEIEGGIGGQEKPENVIIEGYIDISIRESRVEEVIRLIALEQQKEHDSFIIDDELDDDECYEKMEALFRKNLKM